MQSKFASLFIVACVSTSAHADLFGGDVAVLTQILANSIEQLAHLQKIVGRTEDELKLLRDINRGINDAVTLINAISPIAEPGIYKDWELVNGALSKLQSIYGTVRNSPEARVQNDADQSAAEAIALNNDIYRYSKQIDDVADQVKAASRTVSPGGAQKMTVQTLGVMLKVLNQTLRTQATGLKLQAQTLAIQNKKEKDLTREYLASSQTLQTDMRQKKKFFELPRF